MLAQVGDAVLGDDEIDVGPLGRHLVDRGHDRRPALGGPRPDGDDRQAADRTRGAAQKSLWPPTAAIVRPPTRSTLTAPSSPTWSAVLQPTKSRGVRTARSGRASRCTTRGAASRWRRGVGSGRRPTRTWRRPGPEGAHARGSPPSRRSRGPTRCARAGRGSGRCPHRSRRDRTATSRRRATAR